jgi:hypothetical protein
MNTDKEHAQQLLDQLAPGQIAAVVHVMEVMLEPLSHSLAHTALEDEKISRDEEQSVARSKEWFQHNEGIPFEQVVADLGFTMEQIQNYRPDEEQKDPAA